MSVDAVSAITPNTYESPFAGRRQKLEALGTALESGDLQAAQSAFAAVQPQRSSSIGVTGNTRSQGSTDLQAIGQALDAGDLSGAQKAFALLKQHRHHGHHHGGAGSGQTPTTPPTSALDPNAQIGKTINSVA